MNLFKSSQDSCFASILQMRALNIRGDPAVTQKAWIHMQPGSQAGGMLSASGYRPLEEGEGQV